MSPSEVLRQWQQSGAPNWTIGTPIRVVDGEAHYCAYGYLLRHAGMTDDEMAVPNAPRKLELLFNAYGLYSEDAWQIAEANDRHGLQAAIAETEKIERRKAEREVPA